MKGRLKENSTFVEYWERTVPWTFKNERLGYAERRRLRYELQDYMLETIPFASYRGKVVLEIGSGSGIDSSEFGRGGADIVGLDFTELGATTTRDTLAEARVRSSNVVRASAQHLPFRDGSFDCAYSFGVIHHIPNAKGVVEECSRVLKRGGDLICMLYNRDSLLYAYSILFLHRSSRASEADLLSRYSERVEGCPYTKAYTKDDVRKLLGGRFEGISTKVRFNVIDTPGQRKVKLGLPDAYELGWHIIAMATKKGGRPPG